MKAHKDKYMYYEAKDFDVCYIWKRPKMDKYMYHEAMSKYPTFKKAFCCVCVRVRVHTS